VRRDGAEVRRRIGVTGQFVALDEALSGRANLVLLARLLGANRQQAESRSTYLLGVLGLTDAADRKPSTYSGGMRRRLDLAAGLLGRPEVLFLDEPTAGLDPVGRLELWTVVRALAADGTTVVLTTQDLQEAEELATDVVVLAAGQVVARGTPATLKANIGDRVATVTVADVGLLEKAVSVLIGANLAAVALPATGRPLLAVPMPEAARVVDLVRTLDQFSIPIADITLAEPTLNDVYLALHYAGWKS
jgi:ABC-2 type transport system ATP-binding protein